MCLGCEERGEERDDQKIQKKNCFPARRTRPFYTRLVQSLALSTPRASNEKFSSVRTSFTLARNITGDSCHDDHDKTPILPCHRPSKPYVLRLQRAFALEMTHKHDTPQGPVLLAIMKKTFVLPPIVLRNHSSPDPRLYTRGKGGKDNEALLLDEEKEFFLGQGLRIDM